MNQNDTKFAQLCKRFSHEYEAIRLNCCPKSLTTFSITTFVDKAKHFVERISEIKDISPEIIRKEQVSARLAANTLLRRAPWLSDPAKAILRDFIHSQPQFIDDRYQFSVDYSPSYIYMWPKLLKSYMGKAHVHFLEVGSLEGMSACWMLQNVLNHSSSRLTCIDTFRCDDTGQAILDLQSDGDNDGFLYHRFIHNITLADGLSRVTIVRQRAESALRVLPFDTYDFIYLDASHTAKDVLSDAVLAWPLLKKLGLLVFDGYGWNNPCDPTPRGAPRLAIDTFLSVFSGDYEVLLQGYQVIIRKIKESK